MRAGGWLPWLAGSCAASLATLWHIWVTTPPAAEAPAVDTTGSGAAAAGDAGVGSPAALATHSSARKAAAEVTSQRPSLPNANGGLIQRRAAAPRVTPGKGTCSSDSSSTPSDSGSSSSWRSGSSGLMWALCAPAGACAAALLVPPARGVQGQGARVALAVGAMGASAPAALHCLLVALPRTTSLGEGALLVQGVVFALAGAAWGLRRTGEFAAAVGEASAAWPRLAGWDSAVALAQAAGGSIPWAAVWSSEAGFLRGAAAADELLAPFVSLLVASVVAISSAVWVGTSCARHTPPGPRRLLLRGAAALLATAASCMLALLAAWTLLVFLPAAAHRVWLLAYWAAVLAVALPAMRVAATRKAAQQVSPRSLAPGPSSVLCPQQQARFPLRSWGPVAAAALAAVDRRPACPLFGAQWVLTWRIPPFCYLCHPPDHSAERISSCGRRALPAGLLP
jgi:hypothetical protein